MIRFLPFLFASTRPVFTPRNYPYERLIMPYSSYDRARLDVYPESLLHVARCHPLIPSLEDLVESLIPDNAPSHGLSDIALESFSVGP